MALWRSIQRLQLMVRPEKISLTLKRPPSGERVNAFPGVVEDIAYFGSHTRYRIRAGEHRVIAQLQRSRFSGGEIEPPRGTDVWMSFHPMKAASYAWRTRRMTSQARPKQWLLTLPSLAWLGVFLSFRPS
jgi:ABC-type Fe3+/spermidine/putrescine transport system ATPase subunit